MLNIEKRYLISLRKRQEILKTDCYKYFKIKIFFSISYALPSETQIGETLKNPFLPSGVI